MPIVPNSLVTVRVLVNIQGANAMPAYDPTPNDCMRTYSHGAPDGRVDEDIASGLAQGYYTGNGQFVNTTQVSFFATTSASNICRIEA